MGKKITIYTGTIKNLYADNVVINKDKILPVEKKMVVNDHALFYLSFGGYTNMNYACILADEEEARAYMESVVRKRENKIRTILTDPNVSEEDKKSFMYYLSQLSSCIYMEARTIKPACSLSKPEFKELKKVMKKRGQ